MGSAAGGGGVRQADAAGILRRALPGHRPAAAQGGRGLGRGARGVQQGDQGHDEVRLGVTSSLQCTALLLQADPGPGPGVRTPQDEQGGQVQAADAQTRRQHCLRADDGGKERSFVRES